MAFFSLRTIFNICLYAVTSTLTFTFILGLFGNGTIRIRFEPIHPSRYIVNCQREEIIDQNGKIKTPINHDYDGQHPWHLESYPDIPNLHIIQHRPTPSLMATLEFKRFQERKRMLERACSMARRLIFIGNTTFEMLHATQLKVISNGTADAKRCTPVIPIKSAKNEHFFNDE